MPSSAIALRSEKPLTPAMTAAVWEIAAALDQERVPAEVPNAVWLEIPTARLRGPEARQDNIWLRECLDRLTGVKLSGEHRGDPWGAVVLAEWHISQGGSMAHLLIPPAGVHALRSPANFTKIEEHAAHRLTGHGRRLYAILADKKRLGRPSWQFTVEELRALMGVDGQKSYDRWSDLRTRVLDPAVAGINAYGTVSVTMTPEKHGRTIQWVRFEWRWKDPRKAAELAAESDQQAEAPAIQSEAPPKAKAPAKPKREASRSTQGKANAKDTPPVASKQPSVPTPPPAAPAPQEPPANPALTWWNGLTPAEHEAWKDRVGRTFKAGDLIVPRKDEHMTQDAYAMHEAGVSAFEPAAAQAASPTPDPAPEPTPEPTADPARPPGLLHRIFSRS